MSRTNRTNIMALPNRRLLLLFFAMFWLGASCLLIGCASHLQQRNKTVRKRPISTPKSLQLVRDLARPWGLNWIEVEGITLAMGLAGTGSDPPPNLERSMLSQEMLVRQVEDSDAILASPNSALLMVRALLPPGAQKGDRLDVDVRIPERSETTSLQGGWAMLTRMREYALLNRRLSQGHVLAHCQGDLLIDSIVEGSEDPVLKTRGHILGGAVVTESRDLGLQLRDDHLSIRSSARIGEAINRRFHIYSNGDKKGVANPKRDSFISLVVHPRYRSNIVRYVRVIENIPVRESGPALANRLKTLQLRLLDPQTASDSAVQLEAIGADAVPVLRDGLKSTNAEVRFYAAEALAYLDEAEAASELAEAIRTEPAFRWRGFRALGAMDRLESQEELGRLLHEESAETRYGAFRTLQQLAHDDPQVRGEVLGGKLKIHSVDSAGAPLVHVAKSERPEIVIFGDKQELLSPVVLFAGSKIVVRNTNDGRIRVRHLSAGDEDEQRLVAPYLSEVVRAIVELGGGYTDVVQAISEARRNGCLKSKLVFSAIPQPGRKYKRDWSDSGARRSAKAKSSKPSNSSTDASTKTVVLEGAPGSTVAANATAVPVDGAKNAERVASLADSSDQAIQSRQRRAVPSAPSVSLVDGEVTPGPAEMRLFDEDLDVIDAPATVIDQIGP